MQLCPSSNDERRTAGRAGRAAQILGALSRKLGLATLGLAVGVGLAAGPLVAPATAASTPLRSGVFCNGASGSCATAFGQWRGSQVGIVHSFLPGTSWSTIEVPDWFVRGWRSSPYRTSMLISLPILPDDRSQTVAKGATGAYDAHFVTAAKRLVAAGMGNAWIRPGWEFNGAWARWSGRQDPAAFAAYYRHIVTAMRSVPGAAFRFDWNVNTGQLGWDTTRAYPGDGYVDAIGQDVYDHFWGKAGASPAERWRHLVAPGGTYGYGLQFWADFAAAHGKPLSYAEWGLVGPGASMAGGGEGKDDPTFVQNMHAWFRSHPTAFEVYFNVDASDGRHRINTGTFPRSAQVYQSLFSDATNVADPLPVTPAPSASPTPTPTPTTPPATPGGSTASPAPSSAAAKAAAAKKAAAKKAAAKKLAASRAKQLRLSKRTNRTATKALSGAKVRGSVYVFLSSTTVRKVAYYLDDPKMRKRPRHTDARKPFDLVGGTAKKAKPLKTRGLRTGKHTLTAKVTPTKGKAYVVRVTFTVAR